MATVNVIDILGKVYGARGLPFPGHPLRGEGHGIAGQFPELNTEEGSGIAGGFGKVDLPNPNDTGSMGSPIRKITDDSLGRYEFLPVTVNGLPLPNTVVIITGEKQIIETDVIGVLDKNGNAVGGTVFEKVFTRPYDISIITTLIGDDGEWPESYLRDVIKLWKLDDVVTLKCALTDLYLQPENNFLIKKISHLDAQGGENVEIVQIDGRSNIDFELILL